MSSELAGKSDEHSWKMFRGNVMRTGVSASHLSRKPAFLWAIEVGPMVSSPVFGNGIIYTSSITGRIFALNTFQRQIKWHLNLGSSLVSSPLLYEDILICATYNSWTKETDFTGKNFVFAIDIKNGQHIWSFDINGDIFSSPCLVNDDIVIVGSMNKGIYAIDIKGNLQWMFETGASVWSSPSYNGNTIFIGSDDGFVYCLDADGDLQWKTKLNGKIRSSSPCISPEEHGSIFIGTHNGGMYCLNQLTGIIKWNKEISKPVLSSPAILKDMVFFAASDNRVYCLHSTNGSKIWDFETGSKIWSSPSIVEKNRVLFFGSLDSHVYGLDFKTGSQVWKFPTMNMIDSSVCIASSMLFIGSRDGLLYAFGSKGVPQYIR
jgi:outer membrane protein assembly factor BamB